MARHMLGPIALVPGLVALLAVSLLNPAACALPGQSVRRVPTATPTQTPSHAPFYVTNSNHLYALDTGTGEVIWQTPTGYMAGVINSTHDAVFVEDGLFGDYHLHSLYVYRASDGTLMATYQDHADFITDKSVVVVLDFSNAPVEAFEAMTGARLWRREVTGYLSHADASRSTVVLLSSIVSDLCPGQPFAVEQVQVQAVDLHDGTPHWTINNPLGTTYQEYLDSDVLYWSTDQIGANCIRQSTFLHATDVTTGSLRWSHDVDQGFIIQEVAGGTIYGASPHGIYAYRASDGVQLWHDTAGWNVYLRATDHAVSVVGESDDLFLDATTGTPLWSVPGFYMDLFDSHDGLALGQVATTDAGASLEARDEMSGKLRWTAKLPSPFSTRLQIIGSVLVATQYKRHPCEGLQSTVTVTGLDAATGHILWTRELPEADATPTPSPHLATPAANRAVELASRC